MRMSPKFYLILWNSTALINNLFYHFVTLVLVFSLNISLIVYNHSSVCEYSTIDINSDNRLDFFVSLFIWLLFVTSKQLSFFQGLSLQQKLTDCTIWIFMTDNDKDQLFKTLNDLIFHITSNIINYSDYCDIKSQNIYILENSLFW